MENLNEKELKSLDNLGKKYAVAFVHLPSGEVGRSEYVFSRINAQNMCNELDSVSSTVRHFPLALDEDIRVKAKERERERR